MRLVYLGTPDSAVTPLRALVAAGHEIPLVITRPDRRRGRREAASPSPVKAAAHDMGLPVSHDIADVTGVGAELGVVVAYGQIIRPQVLAAVPMINLHFSLLPRWRGAAPVERAILAGDAETGVCVMEVEEGLDTGGVYQLQRVPIGPTQTADELRAELVEVGSQLLVEVLAEGLGRPVPQTGVATYADKITPAELRIDWTQPAEVIDRLVRVGGAWTTFRGKRCAVISARLDGDRLVPSIIKPEGRQEVSFDAWSNGARLQPGEWFE